MSVLRCTMKFQQVQGVSGFYQAGEREIFYTFGQIAIGYEVKLCGS
jgi:hypothetical protein